MNKFEYRTKMRELMVYMTGKPKDYMAFLPMRDRYYRGFSVDKKQTIKDIFPDLDITKVKFKDKVK